MVSHGYCNKLTGLHLILVIRSFEGLCRDCSYKLVIRHTAELQKPYDTH